MHLLGACLPAAYIFPWPVRAERSTAFGHHGLRSIGSQASATRWRSYAIHTHGARCDARAWGAGGGGAIIHTTFAAAAHRADAAEEAIMTRLGLRYLMLIWKSLLKKTKKAKFWRKVQFSKSLPRVCPGRALHSLAHLLLNVAPRTGPGCRRRVLKPKKSEILG